MKYKCVICRKNFARPYDYVTCEERACFLGWKNYKWQNKKYGDKAPALLQSISKELNARRNLLVQRTAIRKYLRVKNALKARASKPF